MATTTFSTIFSQVTLGTVAMSTSDGVAVALSAPGTYILSCPFPWYYSSSDSQAIGSMTSVDAGSEVTITVTTSTVTKYLKINDTSHLGKLLTVKFTPLVQTAGASQAAVVTTAATNSSPYGFATQAQADAIVTLLNALRTANIAAGIIKGSA